MKENCSRLEYLPNEIFIEIFHYCDARYLFHAFHGLNIRLTNLLQSLNDLCLNMIRKPLPLSLDLHQIQTLTIDQYTNLELKDYPNIHQLKLIRPTVDQLEQLESVDLSHLEHLYIHTELSDRFHLDLFDRYNHGYKIFSNGFPNLQSCSLIHTDLTFIVTQTIQSTYLRFLQVGLLSFKSYQGVLTACPNLHSLRFIFPRFGGKPLPKVLHSNLRRLIIDLDSLINTLGDYDLKDYLSCLPNLTNLSINQKNLPVDLKQYRKFQWFAPSIPSELFSSLRFRYHLFIDSINKYETEILNQLEINFDRVHNYRYQAKLIFHRYS